MRSFSYTPELFLVRIFSFTPRAGFIEEFLLHSSGHAVLVGSFPYIPRAGFSEEFPLHTL